MDERWRPHSSLPGVYERYLDGYANDNTFHRETWQDVEGILDRNKELQKEDGFDHDRQGRRIASIPASVYYDWMQEWTTQGLIGPGNMEPMRDLLKKRLRNPDFAHFRTSSGGI